MKVLLLRSADLEMPADLLRAPWEVIGMQVLTEGALSPLAAQEASLVVSLTCSLSEAMEAARQASRLHRSHLPISLEQGGALALLGPLEQPGAPGCLECLRLRQEEAGTSTSDERPLCRGARVAGPAWSQALSSLASRLTTLAPGVIVYELERRSLSVRRRALLASGRCPRCAPKPPAAHLASASGSRPRPPEDLERCEGDARFERRTPLEQLQGLERVVDERFGPVLNMRRETAARTCLPAVSAQAAVADIGGRVYGIGRALTFRAAQRIGLLEALERVSGLRDGTGRPRVTASLKELGANALDPRSTGLYTPEQYRLPRFPCQPFEPEQPIDWIWGFSLSRRRAVLVPADLVFYGAHEPPTLVAETSSGCSMGSSPEEALLFGLLELLERDAALRLWYRREPTQRLQWGQGETQLSALLRARLGHVGYGVFAFDATTELAMPVAVVVALRASGAGASTLCASGAHPRMAVAVERALVELAAMAAWGRDLSTEEWARARALEAEPDLVRDIGDHVLAMACPSARSRLDFLLERPAEARALSGYEGPFSSLADAVRRLAQAGLELIAVDQTPPELRRMGLCCMRAIVPGLIPLHFGATLRRQVLLGRGGERWAEAPSHPFS